MAKRTRKLLLAFLTIALCLCMIVGGTYALFTDTVTITNHLQAGTLDITLKRTSLTTMTLDERGYLVQKKDTDLKDFSNPTSTDNIFGLTSGEKIVPGSYYSAEMIIENNSSVAFKYSIKVEVNALSDTNLLNQMKLTLVANGESKSQSLSEGTEIEAMQHVLIRGSANFTVKIDFPDDSTINNAAQDNEIQFDLIVTATQVTSASTVQS